MSQYNVQPLSFHNLETIAIADRGGKVRAANFAQPVGHDATVAQLIDSLPKILAGDDFRLLVAKVRKAKEDGRAILWGLGGHVIKCGMAPVLIDLMRRGYVSGFLFNGSTSIHDWEIAVAGHTSEDVEAVLPGGRFGVSEETGREMNLAIREGVGEGLGTGESLGKRLLTLSKPEFAGSSILRCAYAAQVPVTVHVAVGTDTPHMHPAADGAAIGEGSHRDFRLACGMVREMHDGGVYINLGSAVVLPEVFLKCVSVVRNLGFPLTDFTTATFDFLQHYRPRVNVVQRPHAGSGGRGMYFTGHHELMIPLLAAALG